MTQNSNSTINLITDSNGNFKRLEVNDTPILESLPENSKIDLEQKLYENGLTIDSRSLDSFLDDDHKRDATDERIWDAVKNTTGEYS